MKHIYIKKVAIALKLNTDTNKLKDGTSVLTCPAFDEGD